MTYNMLREKRERSPRDSSPGERLCSPISRQRNFVKTLREITKNESKHPLDESCSSDIQPVNPSDEESDTLFEINQTKHSRPATAAAPTFLYHLIRSAIPCRPFQISSSPAPATLSSIALWISLSANAGPLPSHMARSFNRSHTSPISTIPLRKSSCFCIKSHVAPVASSRSPVVAETWIRCEIGLFIDEECGPERAS